MTLEDLSAKKLSIKMSNTKFLYNKSEQQFTLLSDKYTEPDFALFIRVKPMASYIVAHSEVMLHLKVKLI